MLWKIRYPLLITGMIGCNPVFAEPLFNPLNSLNSLGYYSSGNRVIGYKGLLSRSYRMVRKQRGILLSGSVEDEEEQNEPKKISSENQTDVNDSTDDTHSDSASSTSNVQSFSSFYYQQPINDSAYFEGQGPLNDRDVSGRNYTLGLIAGAGEGRSGNGTYFFGGYESVDESVSFVADGRAVRGNLEGSDITLGIGVSWSLGKLLTLSGTASYIVTSDYDFERIRACSDSTPDLPTTCKDSEKVKRTDRNAFGIMATLNLSPNFHITVAALDGSETSMSTSFYFTF